MTITQFRKQLFELVGQAAEGAEVWVTHKDRRIRLVPEGSAVGRLSRVTPLQVLEDESAGSAKVDLQREMESAWERDWSTL